MTTIHEKISQLSDELTSVKSQVIATKKPTLLQPIIGNVISYGCYVSDNNSGDMLIKLEGQHANDTHKNPDYSPSLDYPDEYPNAALVFGEAFYSVDLNAEVETSPGANLGRYDIAYIALTDNGPVFGIESGAASAAVVTDFDTNGLPMGLYETSPYDPALIRGAVPVARIYVGPNVGVIVQDKIADIRDFNSKLKGDKGDVGDVNPLTLQSETNAANSAAAAATSETNAASSATSAGNSASAAAANETNSAASATSANNSASAAATSETNAAGSATSASNSATAAATSETNAAGSATSASNSATAAATSETNAAGSATNAANSATAAATSETNAAASAAQAQSVANGYSVSSFTVSNGTVNADQAQDTLTITGTQNINVTIGGAKEIVITGPALTDYAQTNIAESITQQWSFNSGLYVGDSNNLELWHGGFHGYINNKIGDLYLRYWDGGTWKRSLQASNTGHVYLFYQDAVKVSVHWAGTTTFGTAYIEGDIDMRDGDILKMGTGDDLKLWHDGSASFIENSAGNLRITHSGTNQIVSFATGEVKLYCNGAEKLEANGSGVDITGTLKVNGQTLEDTNDVELIQTQIIPTGTGVTYVDFTSFADPKYASYQLRLNNIRNVNDGPILYLQLKEAGEAFGNYNRYQYTGVHTVNGYLGPSRINSNSTPPYATYIRVSSANSSLPGTEACVSGTIDIYSLTTDHVQIIGSVCGHYNTANDPIQLTNIAGHYVRNVNDVDGIRLYFSQGNMNSGSISLYGVKV